MSIQHLNPAGLPRNPAYTQAVAVDGPHRTVYVGGQNSVDEAGNVVGAGDPRAQAAQVFRNINLCLAAAGADLGHVIKFTIFVTDPAALRAGFEAYQQNWQGRPNPPTVSFAQVTALARPGILMEVDAIAVVPSGTS